MTEPDVEPDAFDTDDAEEAAVDDDPVEPRPGLIEAPLEDDAEDALLDADDEAVEPRLGLMETLFDEALDALDNVVDTVGHPGGRTTGRVVVRRRVVMTVNGQAVIVTVSPTWNGSMAVGY